MKAFNHYKRITSQFKSLLLCGNFKKAQNTFANKIEDFI